MKRRTLILSGGALATLSLGATATNATLQNVVNLGGDFRVIAGSDPLVYVVGGNLRAYYPLEDTDGLVQNAQNVGVIGDADNVVGGSNPDVPYTSQKSEVYAAELKGTTNQLLYAGKFRGTGTSPLKSGSRNAIGKWPPSSFSGNIVVVADKQSNILAINPNGDPNSPNTVTEVLATPGNGCNGIAGVKDIDGDGSVEIVFTGGSQQLRYLEQDGTIQKISNGGIGSSTGIGVGLPADFGRGKIEIPLVDGSNNAALVDYQGNKTILKSGVAAKSPVAPVNVNGDTTREYVFTDSGTGEVHYIEDIGGSNTEQTLLAEGSTITPDQGPGLAVGNDL